MATENEKTFLPNFISCKKTNPPTPCVPNIIEPWSSTKNDVFQTQNKGLLEDSNCKCTVGGTISISDSKQSATKNVIFGDYSSEPTEISKVYVKVRTLPEYKGEFGFDWLDVDPETTEIQKIQGVPFSDIEYFYKKGNSPQDLGDIVPVSDDNKPDAIKAIQENYNLINFCDYVDTPFVLLKPGQEATLSLEVFFEGDALDDYISITGDEFYDFEIIDGEKKDTITKKKIVAGENYKLKVKCLKESLDKNYYFVHTGARGPREIGGLSFMENKVLRLKFRVIALVSNEGNPNEKAKALFKKFKDTKVKEYLNNNSLNQAGYTVEIENFEAMDGDDVDDYLYAFDKEEWTKRNLFSKDPNRMRYYEGYNKDGVWDTLSEVQEGQLGDLMEEDGIDNEGNIKYKVKQQNDIDYITIDAYKNKLSTKSKKYDSGGIMILCDLECTDSAIAAYSRIDPVDHYALFVYSSGINTKVNYSHEIGHMLGLPHSFYNSKEKETYSLARESILGNGEPEKNQDGTNNPKYIQGINKQIVKIKNENYAYYDMTVFYSFKNSLIKYINNFISSYKQKLRVVNYTETAKIDIKRSIKESEDALVTLENIKNYNYMLYTLKCSFLKDDYIENMIQNKNYYLEKLNQTENSILFYKQKSTNNIMDYSEIKLFYNHNQIQIMRNDFKNYSKEKA